MTQDNIYFGQSAKEGMMRGVRRAADAVGATLGTSGSNVLIECLESPGHFATNDGATILGSIRFSDRLEEMGRMILYEAVSRANKESGDGSSTTTVLTSAILRGDEKGAPMDIKRSLEDCIPLIEKSIKEQTKEISADEVSAVASISAEDEKIGNLIQEIYKQIGKDGIVHWDVSKTTEDSYTIGTGLTINGATYVSPYMCDLDPSGRLMNGIRWEKPKILLAKQKIMSNDDLNPILTRLFEKGVKELVIFCDEIEMPMVASLVKTRIERGFKTMVIKMPTIWKSEWWEDLTLASGGKMADGIQLSLKDVKAEDLGSFSNIVVTKEDTYIDGIKDMTLHIANLQAEGTDGSKLRASRLNTRTARYFVGAHSESALAYKRLKVEDALNSASEALNHGIVAGGGVALLNASKSLPDTIGGRILKEALKEPIKRILSNAGKEFTDEYGGNEGFDTKTMKKVDMLKAGIVDPSSVVMNAVRNAIGVAASILTAGSIIILPRDEKAPL